MTKTKARAQRQHAKRRAAERYGIELTARRRREIIAGIHSHKYQFVERQSHRISVFLVDGVRVVYDRQRKELVTFLPPDTGGAQ